MFDNLELIKIKKSVEILDKSLPYLQQEDLLIVESILEKYIKILDNVNYENIETVAPTSKEIGNFKISIKNHFLVFYRDLINNYSREIQPHLWTIYNDCIKEFIPSDELLNAKILMMRKYDTHYNKLHIQANKLILSLLLEEFNKKTLTKIQNYATSK